MRRILSFDGQVLATNKAILNQSGLPDPAQLEDDQKTFGATLRAQPGIERLTRARELGLGAAGEFELNLGRNAARFWTGR